MRSANRKADPVCSESDLTTGAGQHSTVAVASLTASHAAPQQRTRLTGGQQVDAGWYRYSANTDTWLPVGTSVGSGWNLDIHATAAPDSCKLVPWVDPG